MNTNTPQPSFQGRTAETTAEEREERKRFWRTIPSHDPPLMPDFEARLLRDYDALEAERDTLTTQLRSLREAARAVVAKMTSPTADADFCEHCLSWRWVADGVGNIPLCDCEVGKLAQALKEEQHGSND